MREIGIKEEEKAEQYYLMVWGDFEEGRNGTLGGHSSGISSGLRDW